MPLSAALIWMDSHSSFSCFDLSPVCPSLCVGERERERERCRWGLSSSFAQTAPQLRSKSQRRRLLGAAAANQTKGGSGARALRCTWSVLECVQWSSCALRLQLRSIDFQPSSTSTEPADQDQSQQEASGQVAGRCYSNSNSFINPTTGKFQCTSSAH